MKTNRMKGWWWPDDESGDDDNDDNDNNDDDNDDSISLLMEGQRPMEYENKSDEGLGEAVAYTSILNL
jgi:hypothetical protein